MTRHDKEHRLTGVDRLISIDVAVVNALAMGDETLVENFLRNDPSAVEAAKTLIAKMKQAAEQLAALGPDVLTVGTFSERKKEIYRSIFGQIPSIAIVDVIKDIVRSKLNKSAK